MIRKLTGEAWKPLQFPGWKQLRKKYALSSLGRVASYSDDVLTDGKLLNGSLTTGYKTLNLHRPGNNGTLYIHREIARLFLPKLRYQRVAEQIIEYRLGGRAVRQRQRKHRATVRPRRDTDRQQS